MIIRRTLLLGAGALALTIGVNTIGQAVELDPKAVAYIKPDDFKWRNPPGAGPNNGVSFWAMAQSPGSTAASLNGTRATISAVRISIPMTDSSTCLRARGGTGRAPPSTHPTRSRCGLARS